jgi:hypothetical protein
MFFYEATKKVAEKFGYFGKTYYLCTRKTGKPPVQARIGA